MPLYPQKFDGPYETHLVLMIAVFLLCWLFNAYKLGRFKKKKHAAPSTSIAKANRKKALLMVLCITFAGLIALACRFAF